MNQRFQSEDISRVSEQYSNNELYQAISKIGAQLESEMGKFGMCSEECFMEVLELLTAIADRGENIMEEADNFWLRKFNEYRRHDRHVDEDDIRKAVDIVFGFAVLAVDSSKHPFYRYTLTDRLTNIIARNKFEGWQSTLDRIFSIPLADGWFDAFINDDPDEDNEIKLPKELDTAMARKYFSIAIRNGYMAKNGENNYHWYGTGDKGILSQLAYFCGKVYGYRYTISGNSGQNFPEDSLNKLFGVTRLYSSLTQVYNAKKIQRWRSKIDSLFE